MHREILKGLMAGAVLVQHFARVYLEWVWSCAVWFLFLLIEFLISEFES